MPSTPEDPSPVFELELGIDIWESGVDEAPDSDEALDQEDADAASGQEDADAASEQEDSDGVDDVEDEDAASDQEFARAPFHREHAGAPFDPENADAAFKVEKIVDHQPKEQQTTGKIEYKTKWVGYREPTTKDMWMFHSFQYVKQYWKRVLKNTESPTHYHKIFTWYRLLDDWQKDAFVFRSDGEWDWLNRFPQLIKKYDWGWKVKEFEANDKFDKRALFGRYNHQVKAASVMYDNTPVIEFANGRDDALPIPWQQLIFAIVDPSQRPTAKKETLDDFGLLLTHHFHRFEIEATLDRFCDEHGDEENGPFAPSKVGLLMQRSKTFVWELSHKHESIGKGQAIMYLSGELVPVSVADDCMRTDGEFVAMSSFIQITKDLCLDRRYRCGFDRYLQHSCDPNCFVDVVMWDKPVLKPIAVVRAKREIKREEVLTLDFFMGYERIPKSECVDFYSNNTHHILCTCGASECREYIWSKKESPEGRKMFCGLPVVDFEESGRKKEEEKKADEDVSKKEEKKDWRFDGDVIVIDDDVIVEKKKDEDVTKREEKKDWRLDDDVIVIDD